MNEDKSIERLVKVETQVVNLQSDITEIKTDINALKTSQSQTNIDIKELTVTFTKSNEMLKQVIEQNSLVISELGEKLEKYNQVNDERYIELIRENSKQDIDKVKEITNSKPEQPVTKSDSFKEFLIDIGKTILKYGLTGGLLYYIITLGKDINL
jgi:chromosome segregation ATPase